MSDCSGNKAAVIVLGIYSGIITIILVAALLLLYRSMKVSLNLINGLYSQKS